MAHEGTHELGENLCISTQRKILPNRKKEHASNAALTGCGSLRISGTGVPIDS